MLKIFSTSFVLAIISTTVFSGKNLTNVLPNSNKNVTNELPNPTINETEGQTNSNNFEYITIELPSSNTKLTKELLLILNKTLNEDPTSIVKITIDTYVDPEVDKVWKMYLKETGIRFREKIRQTTAMRKDSTESSTNGPDGSLSDRERVTKSSLNEDPYNNGSVLKLLQYLNATDSAVNDTVYKSSRRQKLTQQGKLLLKLSEFSDDRKLKFERYREPYWQFGNYVFLRTGSPTTPVNITGTENDLSSTTPMNPMEAFRDCDRVCSYYFKAYGPVCGHRFRTMNWSNQYKNFDNICDIDHENCVNQTSNWHPLYKGKCGELGEYRKPEGEHLIIKYVQTLEPFVYVPPTPTDPTADPLDEELKKELEETQQMAPKG